MHRTKKEIGESLKDYKIRLFKNKEAYGLTIEQIACLINSASGEVKSSDVYRKWYRNYSEGYEDALLNSYNDELEQLEDAKIEIQKERYKIRTEKLELSKMLRQYSRAELFYENIKDLIKTYESAPYVPYKYEAEHKNDKREYVLTLSDIHYGSKFDSINNAYSEKICEERFEYLFTKLVDKCIKSNIRKITVVNLGDTIQGMIHMSDIKLNETSVVDSVVKVSRLIAKFLNELSGYCKIEYYHVPMSNHSQIRPLGTKANELTVEDMEYIINNYIKDLLANNNNINCHELPKTDFVKFDILGYKCIALHGHQVKSIGNLLKDLSVQHRTFYDVVFVGHKHQEKDIPSSEGVNNNTKILMSPSFIGSCPYSDKHFLGSKAEVKLYGFNEEIGHFETTNFILN